MTKHPLILVSPNRFEAEDRHFYKNKELEYGESSMAEMVRVAGGVPVLGYRAGIEGLAALDAYASTLVDRCDGLLLTGGTDVSPGNYGERPLDVAWSGDEVRDTWELALLRAAEAKGLPVLGICRGHQLLNVHRGGSLYQDIETMKTGSLLHRSQEKYCQLQHTIKLLGDSRLSEIFEGNSLVVNSVHHQAVRELGTNLRVIAEAEDGIVEAIEDSTGRWIVGVQWHPEWLAESESSHRIFGAFVEEARRR